MTDTISYSGRMSSIMEVLPDLSCCLTRSQRIAFATSGSFIKQNRRSEPIPPLVGDLAQLSSVSGLEKMEAEQVTIKGIVDNGGREEKPMQLQRCIQQRTMKAG